MKGLKLPALKLPALKLPKTPMDFAKIVVILLAVFSVLSYLGVVAFPVVVESMKTKKGGKGPLKHDHSFEAAEPEHAHGELAGKDHSHMASVSLKK